MATHTHSHSYTGRLSHTNTYTNRKAQPSLTLTYRHRNISRACLLSYDTQVVIARHYKGLDKHTRTQVDLSIPTHTYTGRLSHTNTCANR